MKMAQRISRDGRVYIGARYPSDFIGTVIRSRDGRTWQANYWQAGTYSRVGVYRTRQAAVNELIVCHQTDTRKAQPEPEPEPELLRALPMTDPREILGQLGALWSDDFGAYASGQLDASQVTCALCMCAPCRCPAFGSAAYFALTDFRHGRARPAAMRTCSAAECPATAHVGEHPAGVAVSGSGSDSFACTVKVTR